MKLEYHVAVSALASGALHAVFRSWPLTAASFAAGAFLDADHVPDFWAQFGCREDLRRIFRVCHNHGLRRAVLALHAWEWMAAGAALFWATGGDAWIAGALFGLGQHLVLDQATNRPHPLGYFLLWRARRGFLLDAMFDRGGLSAPRPEG
jgi:hypothetical protein